MRTRNISPCWETALAESEQKSEALQRELDEIVQSN